MIPVGPFQLGTFYDSVISTNTSAVLWVSFQGEGAFLQPVIPNGQEHMNPLLPWTASGKMGDFDQNGDAYDQKEARTSVKPQEKYTHSLPRCFKCHLVSTLL